MTATTAAVSSTHIALHILIPLLVVLLIIWALQHIINQKDVLGNYANTLDWSDLISSKGLDGKQHADWNKVGKGVGVFVAAYVPIIFVQSDKFEPTGGALLLGASLLYLAGVDMYATFIRSKQPGEDSQKEQRP